MTASKVLFDTWAWWEVLQGSEKGAALERRYLDASGIHVVTSAITLGELAAKLASQGAGAAISLAINSVRNASEVAEVPGDLAVEGGLLRAQLRKRSRSASLANAIVLATARQMGARLISADKAFNGELDVSTG